MKTTPNIAAATDHDKIPILDVIVRAFTSDPAARWIWREFEQYRTYFPEFVQEFGGKAFACGSAYYVDGYAGAALWLPPDVHPNEGTMFALLQRAVPEELREDAFEVFNQMGESHPREPHWYLPLIGVDPDQQGLGFGSALMRHALTRCDLEKKVAYLESSNPRNINLYKRHGFEEIGTIQVGTSPPIIPMIRNPR